LTVGGSSGWTSLPILFLLFLTGSAFLLFIYAESRLVRYPTLIFHSSQETACLQPLTLQRSLTTPPSPGSHSRSRSTCRMCKGLDPQSAGLHLVAMSLAMALLSPISGWLADRFGSRSLSTGAW
jgi:MFS family permease